MLQLLLPLRILLILLILLLLLLVFAWIVNGGDDVVGTLQSMIDPVSLAEARCCPLGLNATIFTGPS